MNNRIFFLVLLIIAAVVITGCTQNPPPVQVPTPVPSVKIPAEVTTATQQPTLSLGDQYLENQYKFNSPTDIYSEQFRVDSSSWAIKFDVSPKSENLEKCWFQLDLYDVNNGKVGTYRFDGKNEGSQKLQEYPMYNPGAYKIDMKGNLVTVDVIVAKRNP